MISKEKQKKLELYKSKLIQRLGDKTPSKHDEHPIEFRNFLNNELRIVTTQLDEAKLEQKAEK